MGVMETLTALTETTKRHRISNTETASLEAERDNAIKTARQEGMTVAQLTEATGLSQPRIYQILQTEESAPVYICHECGYQSASPDDHTANPCNPHAALATYWQ